MSNCHPHNKTITKANITSLLVQRIKDSYRGSVAYVGGLEETPEGR